MVRGTPQRDGEGGSGNAAAFDPARDDVFARIAARYDRMCDVFSLGIHRLWKRHMAAAMGDEIARRPGAVVLDVASGTGDIPVRIGRRPGAAAAATVWVTDLCPQMLALARLKPMGGLPARFAIADAEALADFPAASVDLYSMSFAMKICDRQRVLAEAWRVLKPGGTLFCLEAARIPVPPLHALYLAYMRLCMPMIGRIAAGGDPAAYAYLLKGVHAFPHQAGFAAELRAHGFTEVAWRNLSLGIVALHRARKPPA